MSAGMVMLRGALPRVERGTTWGWGVLALLAVSAFAFAWKVGERSLWEPAERASAHASMQILTHDASAVLAHPTVHAWAMAASCRLLGAPSPLGFRLPSVLAAIVLIGQGHPGK